MKKSIILTTILFLAVKMIFAQASIITIFHQDGEKFWVILDGVKQNEKPSASVTLPDIKTDFLRVKIVFENPAIASIDQNLQTKDVDNHYTHCKYIIKTVKKGKVVMRLNSYEPLTSSSVSTVNASGTSSGNTNVLTTQQPTSNGTVNATTTQNQQGTQVQGSAQTNGVNMNTNISQTGNANQQGVQTGVSLQGVDPVTGEKIDVGMNINMNVGENGAQTGINVHDGGTQQGNVNMNTNMNVSQTSTSTTTTTTSTSGNMVRPNNSQNGVNPDINKNTNQTQMQNNNGCYSAMAPDAFASAKNSISSKSFEDTKLSMAKQIASSNCLSSSQVKEIMGLFSFEDSKLTFAKFAYGRVVDKNNYFMVNDAFTFSSSSDELNEFIQGK